MRRSLLSAIAALATVTALALVGAGLAVRPPGLPAEADGPREAANRALVQAFYDAANAVIATGDDAPLVALLASGFVDRGVTHEGDAGRDGLVRRLLAIHATDSAVRLAVAAMAADGDVVIAHVLVDAAAPAAVLGLHIDAAWSPWAPLDVFRIDDGRIAERSGPVGDPAPATPMLKIALDVPSPEARTLAAARVTLQPDAHYEASALSGPRLVLAEAGVIVVEVTSTASYASPRSILTAGEYLLLPANAGLVARNTGRSPAALVEIALAAHPFGASASSLAPASPPAGVAVQILADDLLVAIPTRLPVLAIGRATLEPGQRLGWVAASGPVLLHVEAGTVDLVATGSVPWVGGRSNERSSLDGGRPRTAGTLTTGGGALLEAGAAAEIRAAPAVPATALIVTLLPVPAPPPQSSAETSWAAHSSSNAATSVTYGRSTPSMVSPD